MINTLKKLSSIEIVFPKNKQVNNKNKRSSQFFNSCKQVELRQIIF